jgi:hypothetical protein
LQQQPWLHLSWLLKSDSPQAAQKPLLPLQRWLSAGQSLSLLHGQCEYAPPRHPLGPAELHVRVIVPPSGHTRHTTKSDPHLSQPLTHVPWQS